MHKKILYISAVIVILVISLIIYRNIHTGTQQKIEQAQAVHLESFENSLRTIIKSYENFATYIYQETIDTEPITYLMYLANQGAEEEINMIRHQLQSMLEDKYAIMVDYNIRQLHFHLPTTESFLRMHNTEKYGDLLVDIRESVRLANEELIFISWFEEGKIYNGYRFVFPLFYNEVHTGSVEISISSKTILTEYNTGRDASNVYFIIDKDVVGSKLFEDQMYRYEESSFSNKYLNDIDVLDSLKQVNSNSDEFNMKLIKKYSDDIEEGLSKQTSFNILANDDSQHYIIQFSAVPNFFEETVAYLIVMTQTSEFALIKSNGRNQTILLAVISLSLIGLTTFVFVYLSYLQAISTTDSLTSLNNRKKFNEVLSAEFVRSRRYQRDLSVVMFDIDKFKHVNDTYGHASGDQVLIHLSNIIAKNIRKTDTLARWGGEEFICLLPETNLENAFIAAEKLRKTVETSSLHPQQTVTISIGVASLDMQDSNSEALFNRADQAMYKAKENGRNQVCCTH